MKYFTAFILQKHTWAWTKTLHTYRQRHRIGWKSETYYPYPLDGSGPWETKKLFDFLWQVHRNTAKSTAASFMCCYHCSLIQFPEAPNILHSWLYVNSQWCVHSAESNCAYDLVANPSSLDGVKWMYICFSQDPHRLQYKNGEKIRWCWSPWGSKPRWQSENRRWVVSKQHQQQRKKNLSDTVCKALVQRGEMKSG